MGLVTRCTLLAELSLVSGLNCEIEKVSFKTVNQNFICIVATHYFFCIILIFMTLRVWQGIKKKIKYLSYQVTYFSQKEIERKQNGKGKTVTHNYRT